MSSRGFRWSWLAGITVALGCTEAAPPRPAPLGGGDVNARIDQLAEQTVKALDLPGLALVVVRGNAIAYSKGYGMADLARQIPMTDTTNVIIGSTSKSLTAFAVGKLVDQGKLDLDAPITRYISNLKFADPRGSQITLRQLLTNRSGIVSGFAGPAYSDHPVTDSAALDRAVAEIGKHPLLFAPGQGYTYSNRGWVLPGIAIQRVTKEPYERFMDEEIFRPLGMRRSSFEFWRSDLALAQGYAEGRTVHNVPHRPSVGREWGPSGMAVSNARDIGHFLIAMLNGGKSADGNQVVSAKTVQEILRPQADAESELGGPTKYGLGWEVASQMGLTMIQKGGSVNATGSYFLLIPEKQIAVGLVFNRIDYGILGLVPAVVKTLLGMPTDDFKIAAAPVPAPLPPSDFKPNRATWKRWVGKYDTRYGDQLVYQQGDTLFADFEGTIVRLEPTSDSTFIMRSDIRQHESQPLNFRRGRGIPTMWTAKDSLGLRVADR